MNPVHATASYIYMIILMLSTLLRLGLPSGFFSPGFPINNLYAFFFFPIRATCLTQVILLDFIILIYLTKSINHEANRYAVFFTSCHFIPLRYKYCPQFLLQINQN
jgi:hypothetical protein